MKRKQDLETITKILAQTRDSKGKCLAQDKTLKGIAYCTAGKSLKCEYLDTSVRVAVYSFQGLQKYYGCKYKGKK